MFSRVSARASRNSAVGSQRTVSPIGAIAAAASARLIDAAAPLKSHSTTTPRSGSPGSACSAVSVAVAFDTIGGTTSPGESTALPRSAPRNAPTVAGPQCAGTATTTAPGAAPPPASRASDSRTATVNVSSRATGRTTGCRIPWTATTFVAPIDSPRASIGVAYWPVGGWKSVGGLSVGNVQNGLVVVSVTVVTEVVTDVVVVTDGD